MEYYSSNTNIHPNMLRPHSPRTLEIFALRREGTRVSSLVFVFLAALNVAAVMVSVLGGMFAPEDVSEAVLMLILNDLCFIAAAIPIVLMAVFMLHIGPKEFFPIRRSPFVETVCYITTALGLNCAASYVSSYYYSALDWLAEQGVSVSGDFSLFEYDNTLEGWITAFISICVFPAIFEELAFRGILLKAFKRCIGDGGAIFVTALLFGLFHSNFYQATYAFVLGLVLAYMTVKTNSILPAVITHFVNNSISLAFEYVLINFEEYYSLFYYITDILLILLGIAAFIVLVCKKRDAMSLPVFKSSLSMSDRLCLVSENFFMISVFLVEFAMCLVDIVIPQ